MEFTVDQHYFYEAISDIRKGISISSMIPATAGFCLVAKDNGLTIIGTDLDLFIQRDIPAVVDGQTIVEITEPGEVHVPSRHFSEIVKRMPAKVSIQVDDHRFVKIQSGSIVTRLNQLKVDEFPPFPKANTDMRLMLNRDDFAEMIQHTLFAVAKNETRPALTGLHMEFHDQKLSCVATNSIRLAMQSLPVEADYEFSCIVPSSTLKEFMKLRSSFSKEVELSISENHVLFQSDQIKLYSRLIEGAYPSTTGLIPTDMKTEIIMDTEQMLEGIDRSYFLASDQKNNNVNLAISEEGQLQISSTSSEVGQIKETQEIKEIIGEPSLEISFDGQLMIDALKTLKDDQVSISFNGSMRPILIKPATEEDDQVHLISPVRS
ncbi:DNA polymerase III subunit beta [Pseudalkalibacillus sp. Hm43]|uniref:DNA polymerase III subunit beta n=1 Tax=Pseudalkalibacillus sp. Hm43 TaxID=3450742 RepID=UPI003F43E38C